MDHPPSPAGPAPTGAERQTAATLLILYALLAILPYFVLSSAFDFPDILRQPVAERFALFQSNQTVIVAAYYAFAATGLIQIFISVWLHHVHGQRDAVATAGLVAGVVGGLAQTLGFARWVVAIPFLAAAPAGADAGLLEGLLNAYLGRTVGEHLGSLFVALWLMLFAASLRRSALVDARLSAVALFAGAAMLPVALEPLSDAFGALAVLSIPVYGLVVTWMLLLAYALLRFRGERVAIGPVAWTLAALFWAVNVIPSLF